VSAGQRDGGADPDGALPGPPHQLPHALRHGTPLLRCRALDCPLCCSPTTARGVCADGRDMAAVRVRVPCRPSHLLPSGHQSRRRALGPLSGTAPRACTRSAGPTAASPQGVGAVQNRHSMVSQALKVSGAAAPRRARPRAESATLGRRLASSRTRSCSARSRTRRAATCRRTPAATSRCPPAVPGEAAAAARLTAAARQAARIMQEVSFGVAWNEFVAHMIETDVVRGAARQRHVCTRARLTRPCAAIHQGGRFAALPFARAGGHDQAALPTDRLCRAPRQLANRGACTAAAALRSPTERARCRTWSTASATSRRPAAAGASSWMRPSASCCCRTSRCHAP
jgi:hypothetical protein